MKFSLIIITTCLLSLVANLNSFSCPMCGDFSLNLYSWVNGARFLYVTEKKSYSDSVYVSYTVTEILKNETSTEMCEKYNFVGRDCFNDSVFLGKEIIHYNYITDSIGTEYIFSDYDKSFTTPGMFNMKLKDEIFFLLDSAFYIRNSLEAIQRLEGVSAVSYEKGYEFLYENNIDCFDLLIARIQSIKQEIKENPDLHYGSHKLASLLKAMANLYPVQKTYDFYRTEISSLACYEVCLTDTTDIEQQNIKNINNYLNALISYPDNEVQEMLIDKMCEIVTDDSAAVIACFIYALCQSDRNLDFVKSLSPKQIEYVRVGLKIATRKHPFFDVYIKNEEYLLNLLHDLKVKN